MELVSIIQTAQTEDATLSIYKGDTTYKIVYCQVGHQMKIEEVSSNWDYIVCKFNECCKKYGLPSDFSKLEKDILDKIKKGRENIMKYEEVELGFESYKYHFKMVKEEYILLVDSLYLPIIVQNDLIDKYRLLNSSLYFLTEIFNEKEFLTRENRENQMLGQEAFLALKLTQQEKDIWESRTKEFADNLFVLREVIIRAKEIIGWVKNNLQESQGEC